MEKPRPITTTQVEFVADALHIYDRKLDVAEVEALLIDDSDIKLNLLMVALKTPESRRYQDPGQAQTH